MSNLEELRKKLVSANRALDDIRAGRDRVKRTLLAAVEDELRDRFGEPLQIAAAAASRAAELFQAEEDRVALEGAQAKEYRIPVGTVLHEYTTRRFDKKRLWTGRRGVLEIVTPDSLHAQNAASYSRAKVGDLVVRILRKDGSPSLSYVRGWYMSFWAPEGTDLNQASVPNFCEVVEEQDEG